ncbi:hypothetical protein LJB90_03530 [Eubacteriales bacterium OttesenSCG-928-G02]|nr:hypothetical protein [Eubacteriales bacterium OttesenSCG-928-G02]
MYKRLKILSWLFREIFVDYVFPEIIITNNILKDSAIIDVICLIMSLITLIIVGFLYTKGIDKPIIGLLLYAIFYCSITIYISGGLHIYNLLCKLINPGIQFFIITLTLYIILSILLVAAIIILILYILMRDNKKA